MCLPCFLASYGMLASYEACLVQFTATQSRERVCVPGEEAIAYKAHLDNILARKLRT